MKIFLFLAVIPLLLTGCNKHNIPVGQEQKTVVGRHRYKNIYEVVNDTAGKAWVELQDSTQSLTLHFFQDTKDTLGFAYSPECWVQFPYKIKDDKIIVYWDTIIDTKYNFDLVKIMRSLSPELIGKPFLALSLENDSVLIASYSEQDLINQINKAVTGRTAFPQRFTVSDTIIF